MNPTLPTPIAGPDHPRSAAGLFPAEAAVDVLEKLGRDLAAAGETPAQLLGKYEALVDDVERANMARPVVFRVMAGEATDPDDLPALVEVLYFTGHHGLLSKHRVLFPAYNFLSEYFANAAMPTGSVVLPRPRAMGRRWALFGRPIGFPIGIPASVLTDNARWIQYFAANGFNVFTYRTVRSRAFAPLTAPNWAFVRGETEPRAIQAEPYTVHAEPTDWISIGRTDITTTNSFGVPSSEPAEWQADIANSLEVLASDQLLIVSVLGDDYAATAARPAALHAIATDFANTALLAENAGAEIIEMNLACPNSLTPDGGVAAPLCWDIPATVEIIREVRARLGASTKLVAKLAYLEIDALRELISAVGTDLDGVAGINTLQWEVLRRDGSPTFPGRTKAGVSGIAIRDYALKFVSDLARVRLESGSRFEILGMGGVTDPTSFEALFRAGASAVQTATGAFANPFLARDCIAHADQIPDFADLPTEFAEEIQQSIVEMAEEHDEVSAALVAKLLPIPEVRTFELFDRLVEEGRIERASDTYIFRRLTQPTR